MPNLPVSLRQGVTELYTDEASDEAAKAEVERLMQALGHVEWFEDESLFSVAGTLTAAAPAFLYRFLDALAAAAQELGLPARAVGPPRRDHGRRGERPRRPIGSDAGRARPPRRQPGRHHRGRAAGARRRGRAEGAHAPERCEASRRRGREMASVCRLNPR